VKVVTVVGARPQFIKAAALSRLLRQDHTEVLVHTGQHYDDNMSAVFFDELAIPTPEVSLGAGSGTHASQTGAMLIGLEQVLLAEKPDWTLVYGDTNSTLAGALAAAKLNLPVAHVEAGLRSFNRAMPEEINRVLTDHVSACLLCPSQTAVENLAAEGLRRGVHLVGDVMADAQAFAAKQARRRSEVLLTLGLQPREYLLSTVHRAENTDNAARLLAILTALARLDEPVILPIHPRTRAALDRCGFTTGPNIRLIDPVGYLDMVQLEQSARLILTDSGGIQKEAYWLGVPCVTLRDETEWVETVALGWNVLAGADPDRIVQCVRSLRPPTERPPLYGGDGRAAERCLRILTEAF
jgi:UDP-N-acetylglucosamine 2-epimerase